MVNSCVRRYIVIAESTCLAIDLIFQQIHYCKIPKLEDECLVDFWKNKFTMCNFLYQNSFNFDSYIF